MALQVIGAGFGRTGTASLKRGLEQLGYVKTHHMFEVLPNERQRIFWRDIARGEPVSWDEVFEGFEASVDWPSAAYWRELADHYPDAKVILTVRSDESWWKSARATIIEMSKVTPLWARKLLPMPRMVREIVDDNIWNPIFDGRQFEEDHARKIFRDHIEEVKATIPAERLLVFECKQGWEPLCAFLGKPVPETPFPHVNDTADFRKMIRRIRLAFGAIHLAAIAGVAALAWLLFG